MPRATSKAQARSHHRRIPLTSARAFEAPPPKGADPGPIPASTQAVAYRRPSTDPDESAAFKPLPYREITGGSGRKTTVTAQEQAKLRMLGGRGRGAATAVAAAVMPDPDPEPEPDPGPEPLDEEMEEDVEAATVPAQPPAVAPSSPAASSPAVSHNLTVHPPTVADVDRLWDWIRADGDAGAAFFSRPMASSVDLHAVIAAIVEAEAQGIAMLRAMVYQDQHVGFAMLAPILAEERTALMHIYLRKDVRGYIAVFVAPLVDIATQLAPGIHLAVASTSEALVRLHRATLAPLGFREHVMFIR